MPNAGARVLASDAARHYVFCSQGTAQTIATGTAAFTPITFNGETVDTDNVHDNVTNTSRFVLGSAALGYWELTGSVAWAGVASITAGETIRVGYSLNGATGPALPSQTIYASVVSALQSAVMPPIIVQITAATDYVELLAAHTNAGSRATLVSGGYRSNFRAVWLGA